MLPGFGDSEWTALTAIGPAAVVGLAVLVVAAVAGIASWRRIARLQAEKLALDERLRLAKGNEEQAIAHLTVAEARFQELHARIRASESFVSLVSSAGIVARSISDLGKAHDQLAAILSPE